MSASAQKTIRLPFLGKRDYLQGTTIFDALAELIPAGASAVVKFPKLIHSDAIQVSTVESPDASSTLHWRTAAECGILSIAPAPPSAAPARTAYDEESLVALAKFDESEARLTVPSPFSFCATAVSLNKALLQRIFPQPAPGRWLFVCMDIKTIPTSDFYPLTLRPIAPFSAKLARSRITIAGEQLGTLYFSWLHQTR